VVDGQFGLMRGVHYITADEVYIAATPGAVYKSENGGLDWDLDSPFDFDPSYYEVIFTSNGTGFVSGSGSTGGTILRKLPFIVDGLAESEIIPLSIYPNPAVDLLSITTEALSPNARLSIYNSLGELLLDGTLNDGRIDVSSLASGQYLLNVVDAEGSVYAAEFVVRR
jgi:hypothetical protein